MVKTDDWPKARIFQQKIHDVSYQLCVSSDDYEYQIRLLQHGIRQLRSSLRHQRPQIPNIKIMIDHLTFADQTLSDVQKSVEKTMGWKGVINNHHFEEANAYLFSILDNGDQLDPSVVREKWRLIMEKWANRLELLGQHVFDNLNSMEYELCNMFEKMNSPNKLEFYSLIYGQLVHLQSWFKKRVKDYTRHLNTMALDNIL